MTTVEKKSVMSKLLDLGCDGIGGALYGIGICTFAQNANFAPGGISGLALILNHLWRLPIGLTTLVLNIPLILFSWRIVGRRFILKSLRSMVICTLLIDVVFPHTPAYTGSPLLAALFSGITVGAGLALFYLRGSSSGGTDFLTISINKLRPHWSIGTITMSMDLAVILLGGFVFRRVDAVLYGLITTFLSSMVIDRIVYGAGSGKLVLIITAHRDAVADRIMAVSGRGSTSVAATGNYTQSARTLVMCACSRSQAHMIKQAAHEADPDAFVMFTDTSDVFGEGFTESDQT